MKKCGPMKNIFRDNSDQDLIKAIGNRNHQAFERIVNRYKKPIYNFVYRYLQDHFSAEEVVQELFLRVYRAAPKYKAVNNTKASTWIFKIAFNLSMNELKRRKRHLRLMGDRVVEREMFAETKTPGAVEDKEITESIMSGVRLLPEKQRAALLLRVQQGFSYLEISEILNTTVSSVESLIYRARQRLKQYVNMEHKE
ncbi:MAG: RNA polymerase sigma factor [Candidatus Desulfaltia sp.]|nr:RNA polymerase sigma factor [Candidatus Desulfaltia sp.]